MWSLVPLRNDIEETLKATDSDQGQKSALDVGMSKLAVNAMVLQVN